MNSQALMYLLAPTILFLNAMVNVAGFAATSLTTSWPMYMSPNLLTPLQINGSPSANRMEQFPSVSPMWITRTTWFPSAPPATHHSTTPAFPGWIFVPDTKNKSKNTLITKNPTTSNGFCYPPQTPQSLVPFPTIDRSTVLYYHPLILTHHHSHLIQPPRSLQWPKPWLGEPTLAIHRAASRGILDSNPIRPFLLPGGPKMANWGSKSFPNSNHQIN